MSAWRPSSGTAAMDFEATWCAHCKRDQNYSMGGDEGDGCPLLAAAYAGQQPQEWRWWRGAPICDAFDGRTYYPHHPGFAVADLFPAGPRRPTHGEQVRALVMGKAADA